MPGGSRFGQRTPSPREPRAVFAMAVWSAVTLAAAVLIERRGEGAFAAQLGPAVPCLAATIASLASLAACALWSSWKGPTSSPRYTVVAAAITVAPPLVLGGALWTSASGFTGGYLGGLAIVSTLCAVLIQDLALADFNLRAAAAPPPLAVEQDTQPPAGERAAVDDLPATHEIEEAVAAEPIDTDEPMEADEPVESDEESEIDRSIRQWMTRRLLPDGTESVEGGVRLSFAAGERLAVAHVSFVPPLRARPAAECHLLGDFAGRVRVAAAHAYGLRIESRRPEEAAGPDAVDVAFTANVSSSQATAA